MTDPNRKKIALYIFFAWLFPGLGHFLLGERKKGFVLGGIVLFMFVYGIFLQGAVYTPMDTNVLFRWGSLVELGMGPLYMALAVTPYASGVVKSFTYEFGTSFLLVAAILNYFAMIDIVDVIMGPPRSHITPALRRKLNQTCPSCQLAFSCRMRFNGIIK